MKLKPVFHFQAAAMATCILVTLIPVPFLGASQAPNITSQILPAGQTGIMYSQSLSAYGTAPLQWGISAGALPPGITLQSSTGVISGKATTSGIFSFIVRVSNVAGSGSKKFSLAVTAPVLPPSISTTSLTVALQGWAYSQPLSATGSTPVTWSIAAGSLPSGLTLTAATGLIGGSPTVSGVFSFTVRASNAVGSAIKQLRLTVNVPVAISTMGLPDTQFGASYSEILSATGTTPIRWSISSGALPSGLTLGGSTGIISGYTTTSGSFNVTVSAANAWDSTSKTFTITVHPRRALPIGINMSEAEYSWGSFPGAADLTFITTNNIRLVRLPIGWERAQPALFGPLDPTYINAMKTFISAAGVLGAQVIVDVHNYGRYNSHWAQDAAANYGYVAVGKGDTIGSAMVPYAAFSDLWAKLADALKGMVGLGYYDIMNEPYNMGGSGVWPSAAQTAINAIRTVDVVTPILVEGTQWASAYWWPSDNGSLRVSDPANKVLYEAHLYFDGDGSGTYTQSYAQQGAYPNIGVDRLQPFLTWLRQNNAQGFLGEFGIPNDDPQWLPVLDNFLTVLQSAGLSGTYWNYAFHSPSDPSWWPTPDNKSIIIGQTNPALGVLSAHNAH